MNTGNAQGKDGLEIDILEIVRQFEVMDEQIHSFLYPKLYKLFDDRKLLDGKIPEYKKAKDAVQIISFKTQGDKISVCFDIHWMGDVYETGVMAMTSEEWNNV